MSTEDGLPKPEKQVKDDFDFAVISNRLAVAFAKRESLIKSWTAASSRPPTEPTKTAEELEAEDSALFRNQPQYLGVGAAIPSHFLVSEAERNNKSLRAKFFPTNGLKASKARDAEEKAASAKRGLKDQSSDEEEGRSALGRAKKLKLTKDSEPKQKPIKNDGGSEEEESRAILGKQKKLLESAPVSSSGQGSSSSNLGAEGKLGNEMKSLKNVEPDPPAAITKLQSRPTDPVELKRWKKREKRQRKKLRDAQRLAKE